MSDEIREEQKGTEECKCICQSKAFRKFLVIALGSFVGVFCALSLFAALHRPPMPAPCPCGIEMGMRPPIQQNFERMDRGANFDKPDRGARGDFHKQGMERKAPVKVEVEG
jgi:hypothetical protein